LGTSTEGNIELLSLSLNPPEYKIKIKKLWSTEKENLFADKNGMTK